LSQRAIDVACKCPWRDVNKLASFLYNYNRVPISLRWTTRFPSESSLLEFLKLQDGPGRTASGASTDAVQESRTPFWRFWTYQNEPRPASGSFVYKLYISPLFDDLPRTMEYVLNESTRQHAYSAKLGRGLANLLRPDKFVLYFARAEDAVSAGQELLEKLAGVQAQGVPFTYQLGSRPLISIGVDKPWSERCRRRSWRAIITFKIASIIADSPTSVSHDLVARINETVWRSGIDPVHWSPIPPHWGWPDSLPDTVAR
jgi:hypothetical protein